MHAFTLLFLVALLSHAAVQLWLARRQIRFVKTHAGTVPGGFAAVIQPADHAKAAAYTVAKQRLGMVETVYEVLIALGLTVGGGIALVGAWSAQATPSPLLSGTLHVLGVFAAMAVLGLPFSIYRTFVQEQRFGFNRTRPAVFVADLVKGWTLGLVLGAVAAAGVLWIMATAGEWWWVVGWLAWISFSLLVTWAWPRLIAPLFNKFSPLADAELRRRIDALLARCDFHAKSVFVMDGSRRSSHGNAYFTGFGREKRIVFFDTLLTSLTPVQIESVLAHELAHFKLRHIPQRLVVGALMSLAGFALLGWLAGEHWFYAALGVPVRSDAAALLLFMLLVPAFTWVASPLLAAWSRRHEYQADAFAARQMNEVGSLIGALRKLNEKNLSNLTPHPYYSGFYYSHPTLLEREGALKQAVAAG